jgi:antitoxin component of RelBE/YafQ-DinJ toxin-antitoxin module
MTAAAKTVLYARITSEVHTAVSTVALMAGLSMTQVINATLARSSGIPHPLDSQVTRAWSRYRRSTQPEGNPQ